MKLLSKRTDYDRTIKLANKLTGEYDKAVIFHCYWHGNLNEKHLYSVLSCYYFNVINRNHKIILWLENNTSNNINKEISKYCEIKQFSLYTEKEKSEFLVDYNYKFKGITFRSDFVRVLLLYNYGGCWFDLDCFVLRSFDPIFKKYEKEVCVYQWEKQNYPNNAIFISLEPKCIKMKKNINFIINRNRGWGFQEAQLTYDLPLEMLVLPCSWFNGDWIQNPYNIGTANFFKNTEKEYTFDNFFNGAFCYHWHNKWNKPIEDNSIIKQLVQIIKKEIMVEKVVCVSGYFDPVHIGHLEYFKMSKKIGNKLMVIVNNDIQAKLKKGKSFMPIEERIKIIKEFRCVDIVVKSIDRDRTVGRTLETVEPKPDYFCNGGDQNNNTIPETEICNKRGIELRDGFGKKIQSSSWLIKGNKR